MSDELAVLKAELVELSASLKSNYLKAAVALVDGKTQEEAYRLSGGKAKDAYAAASEMLKRNPKISQYCELVQKIAALELLPAQIGTLQQKRKVLWDIALHGSEKIAIPIRGTDNGEGEQFIDLGMRDMKAATGAIGELNKMDGDLAAIKTQNTNYTVDSLLNELIK